MTPNLSRRSALLLPLATALPGRARAALAPFSDALGRTVALAARPERIVISFNFEEFTAVAGAGKVVASGRPRQVLAAPTLRAAYGVEVCVLAGPDGLPVVVPVGTAS